MVQIGKAADHQRYSYAGYEPEREFKDYTREREHMLRQRNHNTRPVEYTARYVIYRVSGHNGQVFDGNFPSLGERCVKTEAM